MAQKSLATQSPYTFVWHDNSGQSFPDSSSEIKLTVKESGLTIDIAANTEIKQPLILINSCANGNKSINQINIGHNSQIQIIEYLMSDDDAGHNSVNTAINCAPGTQLKHCVLHQARDNYNITQESVTNITQAADSKVMSNVFSFGGNLSRIELNIALGGLNAECQAACLAYTVNNEKQDILLKIDHLHEYCTSKSAVRGVLKDKSNTNFIGKIMVHPGAKKTSADLQIKNLLCSPKAQASNKPELEIYNDDVRCSHGSTTGQLDQDALFYMRSRGIDEPTATAMLISGFIQPAIESCSIPMIADFIRNLIEER